MAYVKIVPVKQSNHLSTVINYIKNPDKTEQMLYVTGFMCSPDSVTEDFKVIFDKAMKKGNNLAHHLMIGFSPSDNIDQETAIEIAQELMRRMYPDNQYILAVHNDREHLHCHIIINAVDFKEYKKIHSNITSLNGMRDICDELCREHGLQVIDKDSRKNRRILRRRIDENIEKASDFDDFIKIMQQSGYEVKLDDHLYFKGENESNFRRSDTMGDAYSVVGIKQRLQGIDVKRGKKRIYANKTVRISNRRRLRFAIDDMLKEAKCYDELIELLRAEDIEIKQGAHLAMRLPIGERYIRTENLGEEYTEKMLRFYFENKAGYNELKSGIKAVKQEHLLPKRTYTDRYASMRNVDVEIRMLNMLSEHNIKSIDDLQAKIDTLSKKIEICDSNISLMAEEIEKRQTIINAIRDYWRLKLVMTEYRKIYDSKAKELFYVENMSDIDEYNRVIEVLNANKLPDGTLPKSEQLKAEMAEYKQSRSMNYDNREKAKSELQKYRVLMDNVRAIMKDEPKKVVSIER